MIYGVVADEEDFRRAKALHQGGEHPEMRGPKRTPPRYNQQLRLRAPDPSIHVPPGERVQVIQEGLHALFA
jgi:hypothetical protein